LQVDSDANTLRLQTALRDLVALFAIPAAWIGEGPPAVAAGLADALVALLQLDFAFVRLRRPDGGAVDVTRGDAWKGFPDWLERQGATARFPHRTIIADVGDAAEPCRGIAVPIGVDGHGGLVAAARTRSDFPTAIEVLLLSLAADHAAMAFHNARLIEERASAEEALRQTRNELVATAVSDAQAREDLQRLADQQTALRRVATLVVQGKAEADVFALAAREVAQVFGVPTVTIDRYDSDAHSTVVASVDDPGFPVGSRWPLDGPSLGAKVLETGRAARIEDYTDLQSTSAAAMRAWSIRSAVGVPILVDGRPWGVICVANPGAAPLPQSIEAGLSDFTELLATAIARAEAREALARLADEQAALRRVATLVAEGVRPAQIFSAVSDEVGQLFATQVAAVVRFDPEDQAIVLVGAAQQVAAEFAAARWSLDNASASARVYHTGRSARMSGAYLASVGGPIPAGFGRPGTVCTVASPIVVEGRLWGAMVVAASEELPPDAEERMEKVGELVATAIANAESKSELAASRRRIVAASDDARRRIERDLHDGTQQRLVSLGLAVRVARSSLPSDLSDLRSELSQIATGLAEAVEELQELSRGIHPAILAQGGLAPALRTLARRSAIPVALDIRTDTRLPAPIEVAAYYVMSEALANAAKHAQASRIDISVTPRDGHLMLSIRDDGIGGADRRRGSGLVGLTDRVEALGGSISIESPPGAGTRITAELPLELEVREQP
jgi:signal transduction histidine kinase